MTKLKPCKLPKNHKEYYYLEIDSASQQFRKEKANEQNQK